MIKQNTQPFYFASFKHLFSILKCKAR